MHELAPVIEGMIRKHRLPWRLAENGVHVGLRHRQRGQWRFNWCLFLQIEGGDIHPDEENGVAPLIGIFHPGQ